MDMIRKMFLVWCAVLLIGNAAMAIEYYWIGNPAGGDWNDGNNWSLTNRGTPAMAVPTSADRTNMASILSDYDGFSPNPMVDANFALTQWAGSYDKWTNQVVNISGTAATNRFRGSNGSDAANNLTSQTINFLSGANFTCVGDFTPARNGYHYGVINQEAGAVVNLGNLDCSYNSYKVIYNMNGGTLNVNNFRMRAQNGWGMTGWLGDIYYDALDGNGLTTHVNADGVFPLIYGEAPFNLYGGQVNAGTLSFYNVIE